MKAYVLIALLSLSGCGWFQRKPPAVDPTQLIVTGAPAGSVLYVDGAQIGQPTGADNRTQVVRVAPGSHSVQVKVGDAVAYREDTYVAAGEKRVVTVLSGFSAR